MTENYQKKHALPGKKTDKGDQFKYKDEREKIRLSMPFVFQIVKPILENLGTSFNPLSSNQTSEAMGKSQDSMLQVTQYFPKI